MKKSELIDFRDHLSKDFYLVIQPRFRKELFDTAIRNTGGRHKDLAKKLGISRQHVGDLMRGKRAIKLENYNKLLAITDLCFEENKDKIYGVFAQMRRGGLFVPKAIPIGSNIAEWCGILEGDGCIAKKYVACGNTCFDISIYFGKILNRYFGFKKRQIKFTFRVATKNQLAKVKNTFDKLNKDGFKCFIYFDEKRLHSPLLEVRVCSLAFSFILRKLLPAIKLTIADAQDAIKSAYIRGFAESEGSCGLRVISLSNKNIGRLLFVKHLLENLGFDSVSLRTQRGTKEISYVNIYGYKNLEKYKRTIGFGFHEKRNKKLENLIKHYHHKNVESKARRTKQAINILKDDKEIDSVHLAKNCNICWKRASFILKGLWENGALERKRSAHKSAYIYTLRGMQNVT